jgi:tetratricopeptide (TPR) repeat protein
VGLPAVWNVPYARNPAFTGREALLDALHAARWGEQPVALTQVLRGLGGVGKTQVALEYAYRFASAFRVIWWLRAEEPATLAADYAALAEHLPLPAGATAEPGARIAAVRAWLEGHDGWLLIFDNAPEPAAVTPYLPRRVGGQILITSRYLGWGGAARSVTVPTFPRDESVRFLLDRTQQADAEAAAALAAEVGDLPIALAQAAGYLDATGITLVGYLARWRTHRAELLGRGHEGLDYLDTVATTWEVAFQALQAREPAAADLLCLCAYLAPEAIPPRLLRDSSEVLPERLAAAVADDLAWDTVIAALRRYALVETAEPTLAVHRLVQAVTRDRLAEDDRRTWAAAAVTCLARAVRQGETPPWDVRSWPALAEWLPHGLAAAAHAEGLQVARQDTALVLNQFGLYFRARAQWTDARAALARALTLYEAAYSPDHPTVATTVNNLGGVLRALGDLAGARAANERALTIDEASYGPDHPTVATTVNNLGGVLRALGDLGGARAALARALTIDEASYGPDHPTVAIRVNNLGGVLRGLGDLAEARAAYERALRIFEAHLGAAHPSTQTVRRNLETVAPGRPSAPRPAG